MEARNDMADKKSSTADRELVIERVFNAPRELVFKAWTDAKHLDQWMGPRGFTTTTKSHDFRVGGQWLYTMTHAEHGTFPNRVIYREIVKPERLSYVHDAGEGGDHLPFETVVTFTAMGDKTKVTMRTVLATVAEYERVKGYAVEGGQQTLDRLGEWLAKQ